MNSSDSLSNFDFFDASQPKKLLELFDSSNEACDQFCSLLKIKISKYQEKCELLDPHLETIISFLMGIVLKNISNIALTDSTQNGVMFDDDFVVNRCFKVIYVLCKVRGPKTILKFLPHEVKHLEPVLDYLLAQDRKHFETWETRYGLLLWLSIIVLIPFDLKTVDSQHIILNKSSNQNEVAAGASEGGIIARIIEVGKFYLQDPGPTRIASSMMLARLFSRSDVQAGYFSNFLHWTANTLSVENQDMFLLMGIFFCLSQIFKLAPRETLCDKVSIIYNSVVKTWQNCSNTVIRKLSIKLAQRIGLTFLKPQLTSWRYKRGHRSILTSLAENCSLETKSHISTAKDKNTDDQKMDDSLVSTNEIYVPGEVEQIFEQLLIGLRDRDTVVRWSAAKGVGRITMRLPSNFADEIVGSIIELLNPREADSAWHGGCLCLAELARRGLLLTARLESVVAIVIKALQFDVRRGAHSIGSNVRDAACYVCWAFARAYSPEVLAPHVPLLASNLLVVAVFDREINCRRAACAAYQENVGRQGNFPHGIEINTTADYFTVGNIKNAFTKISKEIAKFPEYRLVLVDHVTNVKLMHWDKSIRELSADSLYELSELCPEYVIESILPTLVTRTLSKELTERHGSCWGIARIIVKLSEINCSIGEKLETKIRNIVMKVEKARLYRGKGGQFMRGACCKLIESIALSKMKLSSKAVFRLLQSIEENVKHPNDEIQQAAVNAFKQFSLQYSDIIIEDSQIPIVSRYIDMVSKGQLNFAVTRGFSLALGVLPQEILMPQLGKIVGTLISLTDIQENTDEQDAETRRNCVYALKNICETVGIVKMSKFASVLQVNTEENKPHIATDVPAALDSDSSVVLNSKRSIIDDVLTTFLQAICDYSCDNRGDVGSWVRNAAIEGLECLLMLYAPFKSCEENVCKISFNISVEAIICALLKQTMEKINRVREAAGEALHRILCSKDPFVFGIPYRENLDQIFTRDLSVDWSAPSNTFPLLIPLIGCSAYQFAILSGLVLSIGGLTESLVQNSSKALLSYLNSQNVDTSSQMIELQSISDSILRLLIENRGNARVVIPIFKTISFLLSSSCFELMNPSRSDFSQKLCQETRAEIRKCSDVVKVLASIEVFMGLLSFGDPTRTMVFQALLMLLCYPYPKVRKTTAERFYEQLLTFDEFLEESKLEQISDILLETSWDSSVSLIREKRDSMYSLLQICKPNLAKAKLKEKDNTLQRNQSNEFTKSEESKAKKDENVSTYRDLVHDMELGY